MRDHATMISIMSQIVRDHADKKATQALRSHPGFNDICDSLAKLLLGSSPGGPRITEEDAHARSKVILDFCDQPAKPSDGMGVASELMKGGLNLLESTACGRSNQIVPELILGLVGPVFNRFYEIDPGLLGFWAGYTTVYLFPGTVVGQLTEPSAKVISGTIINAIRRLETITGFKDEIQAEAVRYAVSCLESGAIQGYKAPDLFTEVVVVYLGELQELMNSNDPAARRDERSEQPFLAISAQAEPGRIEIETSTKENQEIYKPLLADRHKPKVATAQSRDEYEQIYQPLIIDRTIGNQHDDRSIKPIERNEDRSPDYDHEYVRLEEHVNCENCLHYRIRPRPDLFGDSNLQNPEVLKVMHEWDQMRKEYARIEGGRFKSNDVFVYEPYEYAWCNALTPVDSYFLEEVLSRKNQERIKELTAEHKVRILNLIEQAKAGDLRAKSELGKSGGFKIEDSRVKIVYRLCLRMNEDHRCQLFELK